mmetsp:Transcript_15624/g.35540  ORF Transcript_15624/g.35540 Transcript_15624/m.35540 type:complete len:219 (+) Transcript_15624:81-737(+)
MRPNAGAATETAPTPASPDLVTGGSRAWGLAQVASFGPGLAGASKIRSALVKWPLPAEQAVGVPLVDLKAPGLSTAQAKGLDFRAGGWDCGASIPAGSIAVSGPGGWHRAPSPSAGGGLGNYEPGRTLLHTLLADAPEAVQLHDGPSDLPSAGSALHGFGVCKPCDFEQRMSCRLGSACRFCHICGPSEYRKKRRERRKISRALMQERQSVAVRADWS